MKFASRKQIEEDLGVALGLAFVKCSSRNEVEKLVEDIASFLHSHSDSPLKGDFAYDYKIVSTDGTQIGGEVAPRTRFGSNATNNKDEQPNQVQPEFPNPIQNPNPTDFRDFNGEF